MTDEIKRKLSFVKQMNAFHVSEHYSHYLFLNEYRHSVSLVSNNFLDIKNLTRQNTQDKTEMRLWNFGNPKLMWRSQRKLSRLLSNYLSSVFSHIDYTRNSIEPRFKKNSIAFQLFDKYKLEYYQHAREYKFVQDLRRFIAHKMHLKVVSELEHNIEWDEPRRSIFIAKSQLETFKEWTAESKAFLSTQVDKIYVYDVLDTHFQKFITFQNKIYLILFMMNQERTADFIEQLSKIYYDSVSCSCTGFLPFGEPYIRYLKWVFRKSTSPNMGLTQA